MDIRQVITGFIVATVAGITVQTPIADAATHPQRKTAPQGLIAFQADQTGSYQLYTVRPDGSRLRQVTHLRQGDAQAPDWSPDGRRIVFELVLPSSGKIGIMNADGSGLHWLPITGPFVGQPSFTADGQGVVFERFDGVSDDALFTARLDGSHERRLTDPPDGYGDSEPNASPDGKRVSFVRIGPEDLQAALFTLDLRTGRTRQLTSYDADVAVKTGWSPDSRRILFSRDAYGPKPGISGNVMTIAHNGSRLRAVTHFRGGEVTAFAGSFSPDGRRVVYRREASNDYTLVVAHRGGSHPTPILHSSTLKPRGIDWGPTPCR